MSNYLPPRLPLSFFMLHNRAAHLIMDLHEGNNRDEVLIQLNNFIMQPRSESMHIDLGFHLWKSFDTVNRSESMRSDLGYHLWKSFDIVNRSDLGYYQFFDTVYILLQEVIAVRTKSSDSVLTLSDSSRVCNVLMVFQCMASHPDARKWLVKEKIQNDLYPFLQMTTDVMRPVQLSILNLIDALTKFDESYGYGILLLFVDEQVFSSCVHCIRDGDKPIKKVATLILMKILMQEYGLRFCYSSQDCLVSVIQILCQLVETFTTEIACSQHLKYVVQCFLSLSQVEWIPRVYQTVRNMFPQQLIDNTIIHEDPEIQNMLRQLELNINPQ